MRNRTETRRVTATKSKLAGKNLKLAIEPPYRWRDWATKSNGITGDELLASINDEETTRPNQKARRWRSPLTGWSKAFTRRWRDLALGGGLA